MERSSIDEEGHTQSRVGWRLFGKVSEPSRVGITSPPAENVFAAPTDKSKHPKAKVFWQSFAEFKYEPTHPDGGFRLDQSPCQGPYVDITEAGSVWLEPVHSFGFGDMTGDDWRSRPRLFTFDADYAASVAPFLSELVQLHGRP